MDIFYPSTLPLPPPPCRWLAGADGWMPVSLLLRSPWGSASMCRPLVPAQWKQVFLRPPSAPASLSCVFPCPERAEATSQALGGLSAAPPVGPVATEPQSRSDNRVSIRPDEGVCLKPRTAVAAREAEIWTPYAVEWGGAAAMPFTDGRPQNPRWPGRPTASTVLSWQFTSFSRPSFSPFVRFPS